MFQSDSGGSEDGSTTTSAPGSSGPDPLGNLQDNLTGGCEEADSWVCEQVYDSTGNDTAAGLAEWLVARPLTVVGILLAALVVNRLLRRLVGRWVRRVVDPSSRFRQAAPGILQSTREVNLRSESRSATLTVVGKSIASVVVWITAIFAALEVFDINLGPLVAGAGIAGVALGFGAQSLVRDFLSGTFMILEDQFGVGDVVEVGGVTGTQEPVTGTVEKITLRSTRLRDVNGTVWHIPNGEIRRIGNKSQEWARALLDIDVAPDADLRRAQQVIQRVADDLQSDEAWAPEVLAAPEVWGVERIGADAATIRLVIKVTPASQWRVMRELRLRLKDAFEDEGIPLPMGARAIVGPAEDPDPVPPPAAPKP